MRSLVNNKEVGGGWQSTVRDKTHSETFKVGLETKVIAIEAVDHESDVLRRHSGVGHKVEREGKVTTGVREVGEDDVGEREDGEVSTNVVRGWVEPDLLFECSVVDLEVVRRVTPTT